MAARETEIEFIRYDTGRIAEAAIALIYNFVRYSGIYGTEQWVGAAVNLLDVIKKQKPQECCLSAEGIEVIFSGFPRPVPTIKNGKLVYASKEPRFVLADRLSAILPRQRTRISRIASEISEEMEDVFHVRTESSPRTLVFPKQNFAERRDVFNAAIL